MTEPMPDLLRLAVRLQHFPDCASPQVNQITGKHDGRPGLLCRTCHYVWFPPARLVETTLTSTPRNDDGWAARSRPLTIPGAPAPRAAGWPTHRARARARRR